jgi:hypothetical protein
MEWTMDESGVDSLEKTFLFSTASKPDLGSTSSSCPVAPRGRTCPSSSNAEVKMCGALPPFRHTFMAWRIIKHRDKFTLTLSVTDQSQYWLGYGLDDQGIRVRFLAGGILFFSSQHICRDRGPPSPLANGKREQFPRVQSGRGMRLSLAST